jgi:hypothetical protein
VKKLFSEEPSDQERDTQMQSLRDLSKASESQQDDSIAKWLELTDKALKPEEDA